MRHLLQRSLRLWQRARRPGASGEEIDRALAAIPELCSALDAALARAGETRAARSGAGRASQADLDRLGRYVAHEVRNRLNLVELSVERAAILSGDPRVRSALDPVHRAFRHLAAVAEDLRSAASAPGSAGSARPELPRLPLRSVVEDVLAATRDLAEEQGVVLEMEGECPDAEVDAARLELALVNLVTNALRHADGGEGERWVRVEARWRDADAGLLQVCVRDNGAGIPAHLRDSLFEDPAGGSGDIPPRSGMGLAIVRQAVERSGGQVWVESEEGAGSAFYFTLPVPPRAAEAREASHAAPLRSRSLSAP